MPLFRRENRPPLCALANDQGFRREFRAWVLAAGSPDTPDLPHWSAMVRMTEQQRPRRGDAGAETSDLWDTAVAAEADRLAAELGWTAEERRGFTAALQGVVEQLLKVDVYGFDERAAYEEFRSVARALRLEQAAPAGGS